MRAASRRGRRAPARRRRCAAASRSSSTSGGQGQAGDRIAVARIQDQRAGHERVERQAPSGAPRRRVAVLRQPPAGVEGPAMGDHAPAAQQRLEAGQGGQAVHLVARRVERADRHAAARGRPGARPRRAAPRRGASGLHVRMRLVEQSASGFPAAPRAGDRGWCGAARRRGASAASSSTWPGTRMRRPGGRSSAAGARQVVFRDGAGDQRSPQPRRPREQRRVEVRCRPAAVPGRSPRTGRSGCRRHPAPGTPPAPAARRGRRSGGSRPPSAPAARRRRAARAGRPGGITEAQTATAPPFRCASRIAVGAAHPDARRAGGAGQRSLAGGGA